MDNSARIVLARQFCAERAEAAGNLHTAQCYRSGQWDDKGEMPIAIAMIAWMADRNAPAVWPATNSTVRACNAKAVVSLMLRAWEEGMTSQDADLAKQIRLHYDRIASVALQGLAIDPDARAS